MNQFWADSATVLPDFISGLLPNPDLSIRDHAEQNLYLVTGKNPFPGLVDFSRTPYVIEILDALMPDNGIEKVVLMKGWQTGGTLSALAWMLWVMDSAPAPMLIVQPNDELRNKFSKQRINPIIANCKSLQGRIKDFEAQKEDKNKEKDTIITKIFPGGFLNLGTSKAAVSLRSDSIQYVVFDEVSAYDDDCQGEGDPCGLAIGRTSAYEGRKKLFFVSTPSIKDACRIEREYRTTDQRKFFVPCLSCSEEQLIVWERIDFSGPEPRFLCIRCGYAHFEQDKTEMLRRGVWVPTATPQVENARGYHLPALYAPVGMYSWKSCVEQYRKGLETPLEMKVFANNILGEPYEDKTVKSVDPDAIERLAEDYWPAAFLPKGVGIVTAGVDTHPTHIDIVVRGWGREGESWVLDHWIIYGDSNLPEAWAMVHQKLMSTYRHHAGTLLRIAATCVDTGGHNTGAVYEYCKSNLRHQILPIRGSGNLSAPIIDQPTTKKEVGIYLFPVGKLATHGRLFSALGQSLDHLRSVEQSLKDGKRIPYSGPGIIHFHKNLGSNFFKEIAAPKALWGKRNGQYQLVYETVAGVADHAHDCMRLADAAREFTGLNIDAICDELDGISKGRGEP